MLGVEILHSDHNSELSPENHYTRMMIWRPLLRFIRTHTLLLHVTNTSNKFRIQPYLALRVTTISVLLFLFILFINQDSDEHETIFVTQRPFFVKREDLQFLRNQEKCTNETFLMIYIHSKPDNAERRRMIRNTWGSRDILEKHHARLIFVTGEVADENLQIFLDFENELHKDIIQVNFIDSYRNLTYKAISGLKWVTENCQNATFVLKTDDDIIVDINTVVTLMMSDNDNRWQKTNLLACHIWKHMDVDRNKSSKWYTSYDEYPDDFYLSYCSGSAFIMSYDVVKKFYLKSHETPFFWVDDYYVTGMLALATNVTPVPLNERYSVLKTADLRKELPSNASLTFIHSPDTNTSSYVWQNYLGRKGQTLKKQTM
ncbi:beta-1,3-galactosyltransferase 5-like [Mercenaria mercenaria]|uniref:beta-1,3-galactosyltransferase 5-like n=1 Tax=Mercenaria mercenaria TaxID=6596 RepID=UPI00234EEEF6|nr:beta-1,3-galactosyltransferase 5-like [Mercenaria mercenaria]